MGRLERGENPLRAAESLERIERGEIDPSFVVSHRVPLSRAPEMYRIFNDKQDSCTKVVLDPWADGAVAA